MIHQRAHAHLKRVKCECQAGLFQHSAAFLGRLFLRCRRDNAKKRASNSLCLLTVGLAQCISCVDLNDTRRTSPVTKSLLGPMVLWKAGGLHPQHAEIPSGVDTCVLLVIRVVKKDKNKKKGKKQKT